jgi:hypothetical protein
MAEATTGKELLDRVYAIKGNASKEIMQERNRATIAGGFVGFGMGVYYGYSRDKNMLVTGLLCGVLGAVSARLLMPKE